MIKVLVFDVDGVLVNAGTFTKYLEKDYGIPHEKLQPFFANEFKDCLVGKADLKEVIEPHLQGWGWQGTADEFLAYWFKAEHKIDQDLINYIEDLKSQGIRCVVATNQEKYRVQYLLDEMGFGDVFEKVYASAHLGHKKPATEFFSLLYEDLKGIEKSEILFWDDTEASIISAKEFGIQAEVYTTFEDFKQKMSNYLEVDVRV